MRVVFICGSLEKGKDGVGDYTRLLATQLARNNTVSIIALNDKHCDKNYEEELNSKDIMIPILRIASNTPWEEKSAEAIRFLAKHNADIVSLQYVPYSFDPKGLPFKLIATLKKIVSNRKFHIMFHELWIGMDVTAGIKDVLIGKLQKEIVARLFHKLNPFIVHTHTELYKYQLNKLTKKDIVLKLPLFGNISVTDKNVLRNSEECNFVIFGNIHYQHSLQDFVNWVLLLKNNSVKKVCIHFIGSNGIEQKKWVEALTFCNISYKIHGRQNTDYISKLFRASNVGITTTPFYLVEKSGSVAAMIEHGLSVICVARDWTPKVDSLDAVLPKINVEKFNKELSYNHLKDTEVNENYIREISDVFINDLMIN